MYFGQFSLDYFKHLKVTDRLQVQLKWDFIPQAKAKYSIVNPIHYCSNLKQQLRFRCWYRLMGCWKMGPILDKIYCFSLVAI